LEKLRVEAELVKSGSYYQPTTERAFHRTMAHLPIRHEDFVFIDFGSGKGKCLFMAARYPFRKIVGVELSEELVEVARRNAARYRSREQRCVNLETFHANAASFPLPLDPSVYYFYNPFLDADVMSKVLENIRCSLEAKPRSAYIVYFQPLHRDLLDTASWLSALKSTPRFCIYGGRGEVLKETNGRSGL